LIPRYDYAMRVVLVCAMVAGCGFSSPSAPSAAPGDAANDRPHDAQADATALSDATASCPGTYTLHFGGHSYRKTTATTDYPGVVNDCHDGRGYVVAINDSAEDTWVKIQFGSNGYIWIGLQFSSSSYQWDNHVPLGTYNDFAGGVVPVTPAASCVDYLLSTGGMWAPYTCTQMHQSMCECDAP
jgi:hypothetical protein